MLEISGHSAIQNGYVSLEDSLGGKKSKRSLKDARYVLVNPHGSSRVEGAFPDKVLRYLHPDSSLVMDHVRSDRDTGINELSSAVLSRRPGGVVVNVDFARGLLDANRMVIETAIRGVFHPMPEDAKAVLAKMHAATLSVIDAVVDGVGSDVPILNLHSMEPTDVAHVDLTPDSLKEFVAAYARAAEFPPLPVDLIVGTNGQSRIADEHLVSGFERFLREIGAPVEINVPFDTDAAYPDFHYIARRPGLAIDVIKPLLCKGESRDGSFDTLHAEADSSKIAEFAELVDEILTRREIEKSAERR